MHAELDAIDADARSILAALAPADALLVTESGIADAADAARLAASGARAMLVGESLMREPDVEAATRALTAG
jgi:indole-3-glycerol phosphate synthase